MPRVTKRKQRCCAKVNSNDESRKCKRSASDASLDDDGDRVQGLCTQHSAQFGDLRTCACCLKFVEPRSAQHVEPRCGHAVHFDCVQKWINLQPSAVKTCPTCREPFSHCMVLMLDEGLRTRMKALELMQFRAGSITWTIPSVQVLQDLLESVLWLLQNKENEIKYAHSMISEHNARVVLNGIQGVKLRTFRFKLLNGGWWELPVGVDSMQELQAFHARGSFLLQDYRAFQESANQILVYARRALGFGSVLSCNQAQLQLIF